MDTDSFIIYIKTDDIYKYIGVDFETKFDTSRYELELNSLDKPLSKGKNKKVIGLIKDELGGKNMANHFWTKSKDLWLLNGWR